MDYEDFLAERLSNNTRVVRELPFLVLGADYGDVRVSRRFSPHLLEFRALTKHLGMECYGESLDHMYLTSRVDGWFAFSNISGVAQVRLMTKLRLTATHPSPDLFMDWPGDGYNRPTFPKRSAFAPVRRLPCLGLGCGGSAGLCGAYFQDTQPVVDVRGEQEASIGGPAEGRADTGLVRNLCRL